MKNTFYILALAWFGVTTSPAQIAISKLAPNAVKEHATPYQETERGAHHKVFERIEYETTYDGKLAEHRHTYQELATGMHYREGEKWLESEEKIEILPKNAGATASKGQHKAIFPPEIKSGIIELQTPDGQWLRSRVWGLAYFDSATGQSVLLAEVKESEGQLVGDNVVVYPDAFTDFLADIRYTYTRAGFEQDIVLREQPPAPEKLGLNPKTTRLQVLTEFVEAKPPTKTQQIAGELADETLGFGQMSIGAGKAFSVDVSGDTDGHVPVSKTWLPIAGRDFLIEEVAYPKVIEQIGKLPAAQKYEGASLQRRGSGPNVLAGLGKLLPKRYVKTTPKPSSKRMARVSPSTAPSFVMDYVTLNSQSDCTFKSDGTYYVSGTVNLTGTTKIESGAVIKFANSASAKLITTAPVCLTDAYRMACFTSMHDNTVGENISGSSGNPAQGLATYLEITGGGSEPLKYLRFRYANNAISHTSFSGDVNPVWHSQFLNCGAAIQVAPTANSGSVRLYNVLLAQCGIGIRNTSSTLAQHLRAEQVTANQVVNIVTVGGNAGANLYLTNCLLTASGGISPAQGTTTSEGTFSTASSAGIYQTVGGGKYYLANGSPHRDVGVPTINAELQADLKKKTTCPPTSYTGTTFTTAQTFAPNTATVRDTNTPDRGYHYDPLDYTFGGCHANQGITFTAGTAVGWFRTSSGWQHAGFGIHVGDLKVGSFEGTATAPCYWVRQNVVQESDTTAGYGPGGMTSWAPNLANAGEARARFTKFAMMAGDGNHFRDDWGWLVLRAQDCEFSAGGVGGYVVSMYFTNCFFGRTYIGQVDGNGGCTVAMRNCTKLGNWLQFAAYNQMNFLVRECAFEDVTFQFTGYGANASFVDYDYNSYNQSANPFPVSGSHNVPMPSGFNWQTGLLGKFYLPNNSLLLNTGGRSAPAAGLYHYTTQTATASKEAVTQVDIGYHYLSLDLAGSLVDTDGDSLADYWEDKNGNGLYNTGDLSDWLNADSDGDGLRDNTEINVTLTSATSPDTGNTGTSDGYKDADGDGLTNLEELFLGKNPLFPDVASPNFSPVGGDYTTDPLEIVITCPSASAGAVIYYTTDGSDPTSASPTIANGGIVTVTEAQGPVILSAKAFHSGWNSSDIERQKFIVANIAASNPLLRLSPAGGNFAASDSLEIWCEAEGFGTGFKLQLYRDEYKVAETTSALLRYPLANFPAGTHTYKAKLVDSHGFVILSAPAVFNITASGPVVSLVGTQPFFTSAPGTLLANITGVNPGAVTTLTLNGVALPPRTGEFTINIALVEGANPFTLLANGTAQASTTVYLDSVAPLISITAPVNNATFNTTRVNVSGTFTETSLKQITVNGVLAFITGNTFTALNVPLATGANAIIATAEDIAGNVTSHTINLTGGTTLVDPVQLMADPVGGFAPLAVTFIPTISPSLPGTLQQVQYDVTGNNLNFQTANSTTYAAGEYFPVVTVQTTAGKFSSMGGWNSANPDRLRINVQVAPVIDNTIVVTDPVDLKVTADKHLYILSRSAATIYEYDTTPASPTFLRSVTIPVTSPVPTGLDVDASGNVYVAISGQNKVAKYRHNPSTSDLELDTTFGTGGFIGSAGTGDGQFNTPYDVAVSPDGQEIVVSDSGNHRIQRFSVPYFGFFVSKSGSQGSGAGQFNTPKGLTYDGLGVVPRDVVRRFGESGGGRLGFQGGMRAMEIVVVEVERETVGALI